MTERDERNSEQPNFIKSQVNQFLHSLSSSPTEEDFVVTYCDIFWTIVSVFGRIISIGITINVAYNYYVNEQIDYFAWTVGCFVLPMLVTTFLQITMWVSRLWGNWVTSENWFCSSFSDTYKTLMPAEVRNLRRFAKFCGLLLSFRFCLGNLWTQTDHWVWIMKIIRWPS